MGKRITQKLIRTVLKGEPFRLDSNPSYFFRYAEVAPGLKVVEYKRNVKKPGPTSFSVRAYQGAHVPIHWEAIHMVSIQEAVAWANDHVEEASRIWESEE